MTVVPQVGIGLPNLSKRRKVNVVVYSKHVSKHRFGKEQGKTSGRAL